MAKGPRKSMPGKKYGMSKSGMPGKKPASMPGKKPKGMKMKGTFAGNKSFGGGKM